MRNLNTKGFTLVEVMVSLSIFTLLSFFSFSMMFSSLRLAQSNERQSENLAALEALKCIMTYNFSYEEVMELKNDNRIYLDLQDFPYEYFKDQRLKEAFSSQMPDSGEYISLDIKEGSVLVVNLSMHYKFNNREEICKTEFYKGYYSRKAS